LYPDPISRAVRNSGKNHGKFCVELLPQKEFTIDLFLFPGPEARSLAGGTRMAQEDESKPGPTITKGQSVDFLIMSTETVFVSYSSRDRSEAFEIKALLESKKIKVWLDYFDIQTTAELRQELSSKVKQSDLFCLLLSPSAVESRWVNEEIEFALAAAKAGLRILPVFLRPCQTPAQLENIVGFDASEGLQHESVRLRLLRAVRGEAGGGDKLLLDAANRLLMANRETLARAEQELPAINEKIAPFVDRPIRNVSLVIHPETLPHDPNIILELKLHIDDLYHGIMSFCIARYREGHTWPQAWEFREPPYTDYFLEDRPRIDVQFVWFDRTIRLRATTLSMDVGDYPPVYTLSFDGGRFKPKGNNPWQSFEIPSLAELEKEKSRFQLIAYDVSRNEKREFGSETDIDIAVLTAADFDSEQKVSGVRLPALPIMRGSPMLGHLCLYSSRTTAEQRLILQTDYLQHVNSPIRRSVLLQEYAPVYDWTSRQEEIEHALEKGEFETEEQRRLAARFHYNEGALAHERTQYEEAHEKLEETTDLLMPLIQGRTPLVEDASLAYRAMQWIVKLSLQHSSISMAGKLCDWMAANTQYIRQSEPDNPDFQRMMADAMQVSAEVHAKLGDPSRAAESLHRRVAIHAKLYRELPSEERRHDFLLALVQSVRNAQDWNVSELVPLEQWKELLASEVGDDKADKLTRTSDPNEVPRWLEACEPPGWPTQPLKSTTLQYSLRIPQLWASERQVRGTALEVEHVYRGKRAAEWLTVAFMEDADPDSDMRNWVDTFVERTGFPALIEGNSESSLRTWDYLGKLPGVAKKLGVDEAHAYTGLANYLDEATPVLGRLYILLARRKRFAWKIVLSFETACFEGISEERVYSQDHVRAGAILGWLRLGSAPRSRSAKARQ
jgi:hypothetical protein